MAYTSREQIAKWMTDLAVPALQAVQGAGPSRSQLGGLPSLPRGQTWPHWNGKPLSYLAQLDFTEVAKTAMLPGFPRTGRTLFFYNQEQSTWGFDPTDRGSWAVFYDAGVDADATKAAFPQGLEEHGRFVEKPLSFRAIRSFPDYGSRISVDHKAVSDSDCEQLSALKSEVFCKHPQHQIGGFPSAVQNDAMELECQLVSNGVYCGDPSAAKDPRVSGLRAGASDWILLFQLDSDDDARMMWGDVGMLYFWIRRQDLARCDFSSVWMILQCC
jgi:uncharacterized protein YwqG